MGYINYLYRFDNQVFRIINNNLQTPYLDKLMVCMTIIGGAGISIFTCLILVLFGYNVDGLGRSAVIALTGSHLVVRMIKKSISRQRPYLVLNGVNLREGYILRDYSFPSGHTTACFSLATVAAAYFPTLAPIVLLIALLTGISRIYLGMHYPTDVFIGALIGTIFGILACI